MSGGEMRYDTGIIAGEHFDAYHQAVERSRSQFAAGFPVDVLNGHEADCDVDQMVLQLPGLEVFLDLLTAMRVDGADSSLGEFARLLRMVEEGNAQTAAAWGVSTRH
jgi:hypothetical protein